MISIVILNHHQLVREGWSSYLGSRPGIGVMGSVGAEAEALRLVGETKPRILLVYCDLVLGICTVQALHRASLLSLIVIVAPTCSDEILQQLGHLGVRACLSHHSSLKEIGKAISAVVRGERYLSRGDLALAARSGENASPAIFRLTDRELEIVRLMGLGKTTAEIAGQLGISPKTVEVHRWHILKKLDCKNTVELTGKLTAPIFAALQSPCHPEDRREWRFTGS